MDPVMIPNPNLSGLAAFKKVNQDQQKNSKREASTDHAEK